MPGWRRLLLPAALLAATASTRAEVCTQEHADAYVAHLKLVLQSAWKSPYPGQVFACTLQIRQNFRGEVLDVAVSRCGENLRVHKSFVDAAYLASPLPLPENGDCFEADLRIRLDVRN